jgi:hypothetical protein
MRRTVAGLRLRVRINARAKSTIGGRSSNHGCTAAAKYHDH